MKVSSAWIRRYWWVSLLIFQAAKVMAWFRQVDWSSPFPLVNFDYIQYYARALRAHHFLSTTGRFWGYDPFDGAGTISGPFLEVGSHLLGLVAHALSWLLPVGRSVLIFEFLSFLLIPLLIVLTVKNFGGVKDQAWLAFGFVVILFGGLDGYTAGLVPAGLFGFQMSVFLGLWQVSLVWRYFQDPKWTLWGLMVLATTVSFQMHPASLLIVGVPCGVIYVGRWRQLKWTTHAAVAVGMLLVLGTNWYWIQPYLHFRNWQGVHPGFATHGWLEFLRSSSPFRATWWGALGNAVLIALTYFTVRGCWEIWKRDRLLGGMLASWLGVLFVMRFFGSQLPLLRFLQPGRNAVPLLFLMVIAASFYLHPLFQRWLEVTPIRKLGAVLAGVVILIWCGVALNRKPPFTTHLNSHEIALMDYLKQDKSHTGRWLIECDSQGFSNYLDIVPFVCGQSVLGGPHEGNFLLTRFTVFAGSWFDGAIHVKRDPIAFNRRLKMFTQESFSRYLELYNVTQIAAWSPESIRVLNSFQSLCELTGRVGGHNTYRVKRRPNWFHKGSGAVDFTYDTITLTRPSSGLVQLKFHWMDTFAADPAVPIRPVYLEDDPLPFIEMDIPPSLPRVVIQNRGIR